jgi:hypothetical protein
VQPPIDDDAPAADRSPKRVRRWLGDLLVMAIDLAALLGIVVLAFFIWTLFTPQKFEIYASDHTVVEVASYRGRLFIVQRDPSPGATPVGYAWEGLPKSIRLPVQLMMMDWGGATDVRWVGGSHPLVAALLILPAVTYLTLRLWRRRTRSRQRGFDMNPIV